MTTFGDTLRKFRQASNDPERLNRRLSQERLGELIGRELNNWGYTGAAISDWELGKSRISAVDRDILLALVNVFRRCGEYRLCYTPANFWKPGIIDRWIKKRFELSFPM